MAKFKPLNFETVYLHEAGRYASELSSVLHPDDRREMEALGVEPRWYITETIRTSSICIAVKDESGALLNMMGLCANTRLGGMGAPVWSLKAEREKEYRKEFVYYGLRTIGYFLSVEPKLFNFISRENKSSLRFIKRAGATLLSPVPYGHLDNLFYPFILTKEAFDSVRSSGRRVDGTASIVRGSSV